MTMAGDENALIENLVGSLKPVRALRFRVGLVATLLALAATVVASLVLFGTHGVLLSHGANEFALIANGLFLLLGLSAATGAILMGMPQVGNRQESWKWALAMAGLVPATAIVSTIPYWRTLPQAMTTPFIAREFHCLTIGSLLSLIVAAVLVLWLRRGAPSSPERAGLLVGIGASALGIFAFGVSCPYDDINHIGASHSLCIALGGVLGRLVVPRLIRW